MTPTYPFVELCHDVRALFTTYANQDRVCIPMSEQIPIRVYLLEFFLTTLASVGSSGSIPSAK